MELNKPMTLDERADGYRILRVWQDVQLAATPEDAQRAREAIGDKPNEMDYAMAKIQLGWGEMAKNMRSEDESWLQRTDWVVPFGAVLVVLSLVLSILSIIQALYSGHLD